MTLADIDAKILFYETAEARIIGGGLQAFSADGRSGQHFDPEFILKQLAYWRAMRDRFTRGGSVTYGVPV